MLRLTFERVLTLSQFCTGLSGRMESAQGSLHSTGRRLGLLAAATMSLSAWILVLTAMICPVPNALSQL